jgi:RNA polymerase sigma factor (sigma-70 family)
MGTEEQLMVACAPAALRRKSLLKRLFAEQHGALQVFFYRRVRARPDANDLVQEVYARMLKVSDLDAICNPEAYLFTVASNLSKEYAFLQRHVSGAVDVNDPLVEAQVAEPFRVDQQVDDARRAARLSEVLAQLSPKCRAAVIMQYRFEMSYQEIASRLEVSPHMVKKYLAQALSHCRRRMARWG